MTIPYGRQNISEEDIDSVVRVLRSDFLTQGPAVPRFESAIAAYTGAAYCVAVNSATSGLHIALLSLGVGPSDVVWTVPISFVASANVALYCGAEIDFVDICPDTFNMDMSALEAKLERAQAAGRLPKVVIPVHLTGRSCDMKALDRLRRLYGFRVVEDASHAIGASYDGTPVGSCTYSDLCVFSFHPVKIITTGEGGAVTTQDSALARRMALYRSHGITRDPSEMERNDGAWYYEQHLLGFNYRMTEMQAALGLSQMTRLEEFVARRRVLAARYTELLSASEILLPQPDTPTYGSSWHLYVIRVNVGSAALQRSRVFESLRTNGIGVNVHYIPITRQPYYRKLGFHPSHFPVSEAYYERAISVPLFFDLTEGQQDHVVRCLVEPPGYQTIF